MQGAAVNNAATENVARGVKCERTCKSCGKQFVARVADAKRGWARFCSKSCKAIEQEQRTGQYRDRIDSGMAEAHTINAMSPSERASYFDQLRDLENEAAMDEAFSSHGQDDGW